jgi:hypothetical protein
MKRSHAIRTAETQTKLRTPKDMPIFAPIVRPVLVCEDEAEESDGSTVELCWFFSSGSGIQIPSQLDAHNDCSPVDLMVVVPFWMGETSGVFAWGLGAWATHHFEVF